MRAITLGAIAIASTLTFACTTTTTETTSAGPGSSANVGSSTVEASESQWQSKLALTQSHGLTKTIATLSSLKNTGSPAFSFALSNAANAHDPRDDDGGGGDAGADDAGSDGGECGLSTGDPTCDGCLDASCCADTNACANDADCSALIACGDACSDDACINACMNAHPSGANLLNTVMTCLQNDCSSACGEGTSGGPPPGSGSACGFDSGSTTCDSCLDTHCCSDADACENDADCVALMDCGSRCTDDACETACEAAHPEGTAIMNTLSACANNTCSSACSGVAGSDDGGAASCGLTSGNATCDTCLNASCCAETTTCVDDTDCVALVLCYDACSDDACASACNTAHPSGLTKLDAVSSCAETSCSSQCGL